jgi:hypothetical protein
MFTMQYRLESPNEFDMDGIRCRVAEMGFRFDQLNERHFFECARSYEEKLAI